MSLYGLLLCHITVGDAMQDLQVIYSNIHESDKLPEMETVGHLNIISQIPGVFSKNEQIGEKKKKCFVLQNMLKVIILRSKVF